MKGKQFAKPVLGGALLLAIGPVVSAQQQFDQGRRQQQFMQDQQTMQQFDQQQQWQPQQQWGQQQSRSAHLGPAGGGIV